MKQDLLLSAVLFALFLSAGCGPAGGKKDREAALVEKKKAEKALADAIRDKADVGAKDLLEEVKTLMDQAKADLEGSNATKVKAVPKTYQRAMEMVKLLRDQSRENK